MPKYQDASTSKKKVDMVGHLIMEKKGFFKKKKLTFIVHQKFLEYMNTLNEASRKELLEEVTQQALDRYQMLNDPKYPFYQDEDGFEHYRSVKYKLLYEHVATMLAIAWGHK
jgi:hypothetical protein